MFLDLSTRNAGEAMDRSEFKCFRKRLDKTQKQMAHLLGVSLKAVHSYEQGWRAVPSAVERQLFFLVSRLNSGSGRKACWEERNCSPERQSECPACEFNSGDLCWFVNGTVCHGQVQNSWEDKMKLCRSCEVFISQISV
jgi:DNA-binding transcriptional regulator YiaG